ncbi:hypothetical protein GQ54DRAFT_69689 [Martensiomyces pterosporus]|nr:hypothetical protein GQ54DRAFT_69689 [Martensiomyces pterosporus]
MYPYSALFRIPLSLFFNALLRIESARLSFPSLPLNLAGSTKSHLAIMQLWTHKRPWWFLPSSDILRHRKLFSFASEFSSTGKG